MTKQPDEIKVSAVDTEMVEFESNIYAGAGKTLPFPPDKTKTAVPLPPTLAKAARDGRVELITIHGDSLQGVGIYDGDQVLARVVTSVREIKGEVICIVRLLSTGEVLAKKLRVEREKVKLKSFNPSVPSLWVELGDVEVQGIILKVLRGPDDFGRFDRGHGVGSDIPF